MMSRRGSANHALRVLYISEQAFQRVLNYMSCLALMIIFACNVTCAQDFKTRGLASRVMFAGDFPQPRTASTVLSLA